MYRRAVQIVGLSRISHDSYLSECPARKRAVILSASDEDARRISIDPKARDVDRLRSFAAPRMTLLGKPAGSRRYQASAKRSKN
jgi:hypothetical protein